MVWTIATAGIVKADGQQRKYLEDQNDGPEYSAQAEGLGRLRHNEGKEACVLDVARECWFV